MNPDGPRENLELRGWRAWGAADTLVRTSTLVVRPGAQPIMDMLRNLLRYWTDKLLRRRKARRDKEKDPFIYPHF